MKQRKLTLKQKIAKGTDKPVSKYAVKKQAKLAEQNQNKT